MTPTVIDIFNHILPPDVAKLLAQRGMWYSSIPTLLNAEERVKRMNKHKVEKQVLSLVPTLLSEDASLERTNVCRLANDGIARLVKLHAGRFEGVASVDLSASVEDANEELDRAVEELGLRGVLLLSNIDGMPLDSKELFPFFRRVVKHGVPILLHPTFHERATKHEFRNAKNWKEYRQVNKNNTNVMLGWPFDTSRAMVALVLGGVLDKYPSLKVVTHHLGGMVPYYMGRVNTGATPQFVRVDPKSKKERPLVEYFKKFYADTAVDGWAPALRLGYSFFGADHVVFGSDYPFGPEHGDYFLRESINAVLGMDRLGTEEKEKILSENAKRLLKLD